MKTISFIVRLRVPDNMTAEEAQANLRTSVAFGKPEISLYYLFADDGPDSLAAGNQVE